MNAIFFSPAAMVDPDAARDALWKLIGQALADGDAHVVVFSSAETGDGRLRHKTVGGRTSGGDDLDVSDAVASYREGYADGYVDCLTIMGGRN